jgi:hypothetical protein
MLRIKQIEPSHPQQRATGRAVAADSRRHSAGATVLFGIILATRSFACWPDPVITRPETPSPGALRAETINIPSGGELVIFFEKLGADAQTAGESEMPLLAVLRDTMGDDDPANDRFAAGLGVYLRVALAGAANRRRSAVLVSSIGA